MRRAVRVLFLTTALAPDEPSPAGQLHADWLRDLRRHHLVDVVAGYRRDRRLIPSQALGVDLCGKRGVGAAWALRRRAPPGEVDVLQQGVTDGLPVFLDHHVRSFAVLKH